MDEDDEFGFDDDALDALPDVALQQLERDAFLSTQAQAQARKSVSNARPPSDYGLDDEEVVDLDAFPQDVQQFSQWPQQARFVDRSAIKFRGGGDSQVDPGQPSVDVTELQRYVFELESERSNLQRAVEDANAAAQAKSGEALVIRQRLDRSTRDYEQKLNAMRQLHADAITKQKAELASVRKEREKIATSNRFLEHDLVVEAGKTKHAAKPARPGAERPGSAFGTPKKSKNLPYRDGFEDGDIIMHSPSRTRDKSKQSTPKGGAKRKRTITDQSPIAPLPLPLVSPGHPKTPVKEDSMQHVKASIAIAEELAKQTGTLRLLRRVLNHKVNFDPANDRTLEALTKFALPSRPDRKLSTVVYDDLSNANSRLHHHGLAGILCDTFLQLWSDCLQESYFNPINILIDILQVIVSTELHRFVKTLPDRLVPLAIGTCDIIAIPIGQASINRGRSKEPQSSQKPEDPLASLPNIDVYATLTLLHTTALACVGDRNATINFWSLMKFDFILLMLMRAQALPQINIMLQLLRISSLDNSFGAILEDIDGNQMRQARREKDSIERLTSLLFDKFKIANLEPNLNYQVPIPSEADENVGMDKQIEKEDQLEITTLRLRLTIISILQSLIGTDHGRRLLAQHRTALGRLVRFLHISITRLYNMSPLTHSLHITGINATTRILFHVVMTRGGVVDIREKLRTVNGGSQMWLIALTRLAFAEPLVMEEGIEEETQDCAHALLDEYLSPVEGEALMQMFASGTSDR